MPYSSSLTDKEWELIEPLLPQKKKLDRRVGQKDKSLMASSINSRMAVIGVICPSACRPTQPSPGITSNGVLMAY